MAPNEIAKVYDTIMSIPGMNETVKIDVKLSRKNILLMKAVIDRGLSIKEDDKQGSLLENVPEESLKELKEFTDECLNKASLTELNDKLKNFSVK